MTPGRPRDIEALAAVLDLLPTPAVLLEPGSARTLFANRAAHRLAGGDFPSADGLEGREALFTLFDDRGEPMEAARAPAVRAARGERVVNEPVDWETPGNGRRSLIVSADTVPDGSGEAVVVATFEDVTELRAAERSQRRVRQEIQAILEGVAEAVVAQAPDGEIVYANPAAVRMLGFDSVTSLREAPLDTVRDRMSFSDELRREVPVQSLPGRRALAGEQPEPVVLRFRPPSGGPERWARLKAQPLRDERGQVRLAITVMEDITELKQAEQEQRFLAEAGRVLASSLDYERTLRTVAALAVPAISDWCVVDLRTGSGFERVAIAHADPAKLRWTEEISRRYPPDPGAAAGVPQVLRTGRSEHYPEIPDELLAAAAQDEEHLRLLREVGMVSAMVVPMTTAAGETVGAITMVSAESGRRFDEGDIALAEELGLRAASAIENARLYRQRSEIATALQASLLPPVLPQLPRVDTAAVYRPAGEGYEVGGDFYDLFPTGEDRWYAVVGDVCGKGPEAAATTAMVRYTVRAAAVGADGPASILHTLNDAMLRQQGGALRFCTLAVVQLDVGGPQVRARSASGGHPLPRLLRADGTVERLGAHGTAIGITPELEIEQREAALGPGDSMVVFTDGVVEARAPDVIWTMDDVDGALRPLAGRPPEEVVDAFARAATGEAATLRDDLAVLGLRVRPS